MNSDVKQSFDHSVTVRKSLLGVKLGLMNCQSIGGMLDFVFDHVKESELIGYWTLNNYYYINWTLWL